SRARLRRRAEPRRPAQDAPPHRHRRPAGAAGVHPSLRRGAPPPAPPAPRERPPPPPGPTTTASNNTTAPPPPTPPHPRRRTPRHYEGSMSTLCAGCGHDSVTAAVARAFFELSVAPHTVAKLSGIGCSSKTPTYFLRGAHGFNSAHGRMPALATGANAANRDLLYVGISGDGDSLSIGLGHLCHAIRRNLRMLYVIENNGVYGLTKGQFSASADVGSKSKRGEPNPQRPIDPAMLALSLGATFVARSFSGDK